MSLTDWFSLQCNSAFGGTLSAENTGDIVPTTEQNNEMAATTQMQQEDLAALFARTMNFSKPITPPPEAEPQLQIHTKESNISNLAVDTSLTPPPQPIMQSPTYASVHYTPTRHMLPMRFTSPEETNLPATRFYDEDGALVPTPQATPTARTFPSDEELIDMLAMNGIDHTLLFPSQVNLFRNAEAEQRLRLLELWRISPPNCGAYNIPQEQSTWLETDMAKEEALAGLRYDRMMESRRNAMQSSNALQQITSAPVESSKSAAEPYMMSGYEQLAQREYQASMAAQQQYHNEASSPQAYAPQSCHEVRSNSAPASVDYSQAIDPAWQRESMANAYGQFEAMREAGMCQSYGMGNVMEDDMVM